MKLSFSQKENLVIAIAWMVVYASIPLYMYYGLLAINQTFMWHEVWVMWSYITTLLAVFLINHYVLIPHLVEKKKILLYAVVMVALLALFVCYLRWQAPDKPPHLPREMHVTVVRKSILPSPPDMARLVIAMLLIGMDLGVAAWFKEQKMRQRLLLLEQQNLKQELDHLRYQINPHFFMNTLNNIHMLIDIDQERAKRAVVELSGMMRYSLYEGNGNMVPLAKEIEFVRLYISLMKLRYTEKVDVQCDMPEHLPHDVQIMPLLLPTFVENAFKHGVSYLEPSFIKVSLTLSTDRHELLFVCSNSRFSTSAATKDGHHGIGLENVKKRLELKYADAYHLDIDDSNDNVYVVRLTIPVYDQNKR